ncbi:MAG: formate/nitrite transporter family protein [Lachnospiraceae bacterium]|nr:formate/nitrite transporter family protein [Lachnospiraceae bacterium]
MLKKILSGITAASIVSMGGSAFLSSEIKPVGAFLFTLGLLGVCYYGLNLYTGKVGYMIEKHDREAWSTLLWGLLGNFIGSVLCGLALSAASPALAEKAKEVCETKLALSPIAGLIKGFFCGVLIYLGADLFRRKGTLAGILVGVPVFVLSGFEHSIADMFYFTAAGVFSFKALGFIVLIVVGNGIGSLVFDRLLHGAGVKA